MGFRTNAAPYQRAKNSTLKIMLILLAALLVVWGFGIAYSFKLDGYIKTAVDAFNETVIKYNETNKVLIEMGRLQAKELLTISGLSYGVRAILMVVISVFVTAVCDVLTTIIRHSKNSKLSLGKEILRDLVHNYSWITAIIFTLTVPVYTPFYVVIVGSIFSTVVVKNFFGGFGKNIFNPAIMGRIFVGLCFGASLSVPSIFKDVASGFNGAIASSISGIDGVTGATLTTAMKNSFGWLSTTYTDGIQTIYNGIFADYSISDMLFGNYLGSLGETFTVVILVLGVILSLLKVINWRTPVFYLGTVALTSLVVALVCGFDNPLSYVVYHLSLGGVVFGAVFMLTDPVTGPTSPFGKTLTAVFAGLMTVLIRVAGGYPEGVMFSIALCNLISPAIDYFTVGKSNSHLLRKTALVVGTLLISIGLSSAISVSANGGRSQYAINGIDKVQYEMLTKTLNLKDGETLKVIENYQPKTSNVKEFVLDAENNISLASAYDVIDADGNKVATAYMVSITSPIDAHGNEMSVTSYSLVAIDNSNKIYGITVLQAINTNGYPLQENINKFFTEQFIGKDNSNYTDSSIGVVTGATESSKYMKKVLEAAFEEHLAN